MRLVAYWIADQLPKHPELDPVHESLLLGAREQTNAWLETQPADRHAWLREEKWVKDERQSSLQARLSLIFSGLEELHRNGVFLYDEKDHVLGVVREAAFEDDYILYDPKTAGTARYETLEALCESAAMKALSGKVGIYKQHPRETPTPTAPTPTAPTPTAPTPTAPTPTAPTPTAPTPTAPTPTAPTPSADPLPAPAPVIRAKKPPTGGGKKRTTPPASNASQPAPAKKPAGEGAVALIEESSGETAK
jgi:hypothetical protein